MGTPSIVNIDTDTLRKKSMADGLETIQEKISELQISTAKIEAATQRNADALTDIKEDLRSNVVLRGEFTEYVHKVESLEKRLEKTSTRLWAFVSALAVAVVAALINWVVTSQVMHP